MHQRYKIDNSHPKELSIILSVSLAYVNDGIMSWLLSFMGRIKAELIGPNVAKLQRPNYKILLGIAPEILNYQLYFWIDNFILIFPS